MLSKHFLFVCVLGVVGLFLGGVGGVWVMSSLGTNQLQGSITKKLILYKSMGNTVV